MTNRRTFLQNSSALLGGSLLVSAIRPDTLNEWQKKMAPSDQLTVAAIGINGMGFADLSAALKVPGVRLAALCDVDSNVLAKRMGDLSKMSVDLSAVKTYTDYRQVLERK